MALFNRSRIVLVESAMGRSTELIFLDLQQKRTHVTIADVTSIAPSVCIVPVVRRAEEN